MTDVVDVLVRAGASIADPKDWWDGRRSAQERETRCLLVALADSTNWDEKALSACIVALGVGDVPRFNDTHTHAEVLALVNKTIATERAKRGTEKLIDDAPHSPTSEPPPVYTVERVW